MKEGDKGAYAHDDAILQARELLKGRYIVLDTETTSLHDAEVCQLAYLREDTAARSWLVKPVCSIEASATGVHGITNEKVADSQGIEVYWPQIEEDWLGRTLIGYNVQYDLKALKRSFNLKGINFEYTGRTVFDVMYAYAAFYGEIHPKYGTFKWQKLGDALKQCSIEWGSTMHDALTDARATLALLWYISEQIVVDRKTT